MTISEANLGQTINSDYFRMDDVEVLLRSKLFSVNTDNGEIKLKSTLKIGETERLIYPIIRLEEFPLSNEDTLNLKMK